MGSRRRRASRAATGGRGGTKEAGRRVPSVWAKNVAGGYPAPVALGQIGEPQGADRNALEVENRVAEQLGGLADLSVTALPHHQFQLAVRSPGSERSDPQRLAGVGIERDSGCPALQGCWLRVPLHPDSVGAGMAVAGMGEPQGEIAVVAE